MNNGELTGMISLAVNTRMALVISLEGVVGNEPLVLRIQQEFQGLRSDLLAGIAPQGEEAALPPPVPVSSPVELALRREIMLVRKANRALAKDNKCDVLRKKALDKIKLPLHKKLYNSYIAVKHLLEDVKEEAIIGAPTDWESLGDADMGDWAPDQCSFTLHNIILAVKNMAK